MEVVAYVLWLAAEPIKHGDLLLTNRMPPFRNILQRIGWETEYDRTYGPLSEVVHLKQRGLGMYHEADYRTADLPAPEVRPDSEAYVLFHAGALHSLVSFSPMDRDDAELAYGLYVRAKALDIVLAGMLALYGDGAVDQSWWPTDAAERFAQLMASDKDLAGVMLTRLNTLL